jgi:hypothetical protein
VEVARVHDAAGLARAIEEASQQQNGGIAFLTEAYQGLKGASRMSGGY